MPSSSPELGHVLRIHSLTRDGDIRGQDARSILSVARSRDVELDSWANSNPESRVESNAHRRWTLSGSGRVILSYLRFLLAAPALAFSPGACIVGIGAISGPMRRTILSRIA